MSLGFCILLSGNESYYGGGGFCVAGVVVVTSVVSAHAPGRVVRSYGICEPSPGSSATPEAATSTLGSVGTGRQVDKVAAPIGQRDRTAGGRSIMVNIEEGGTGKGKVEL
ncbi:hypothetical protein HYQ46_002430 [Verticillium longisporum]|nr:hypothetical protein HYQ46_002430 [Verticillium longisporum]